MQRKQLARYHDVAASTKARGEGIGFAGVGIKLGLLVSSEVVTETRRGPTNVATRWHLASRHRAPWKWIPPPGLTTSRGTAVRLTIANQLSPLLDAGYVEEVIRQHFEPLLDPAFDEILRRHYRSGVKFEVDGRHLQRVDLPHGERAHVAIRLGRRRNPSAVGFIERHPQLPPEHEGIAISTFGKIIKRGWDWLGVTPPSHRHVGELIEAPDLAACLTLSKNDFIRTRPRGATYLAYRKAIQEVVSRQLALWGDTRDADARPRTARLERDLERVLEDLADEFPLLRSLVDRRSGGQKRLPMTGRGDERVPAPLFANIADGVDDHGTGIADASIAAGPAARPHPSSKPEDQESREPQEREPPPGHEPSAETDTPATAIAAEEQVRAAAVGSLDTVAGRKRPARYGLHVQFESRPDDLELARLVDSTIWINDAHPAFTRALASRSLGYHTALAVALALAPLAVEPQQEHAFLTQFLAHRGGSSTASRRGRRRPPPPPVQMLPP